MRNQGLGADATTPTTAGSAWGAIGSSLVNAFVTITANQYQSQINQDQMDAQKDLELAKAAALNAQANALSVGAQLTKPRYLIGYALGGVGILLLGGAWMLSKRKSVKRNPFFSPHIGRVIPGTPKAALGRGRMAKRMYREVSPDTYALTKHGYGAFSETDKKYPSPFKMMPQHKYFKTVKAMKRAGK